MPNEEYANINTPRELIKTIYLPNEPFHPSDLYLRALNCPIINKKGRRVRSYIDKCLENYVRSGFLFHDNEHHTYLYTYDETTKRKLSDSKTFYPFSQKYCKNHLSYLEEKYSFTTQINDFFFNIRDNIYILLATHDTFELLRLHKKTTILNEEPLFIDFGKRKKLKWRVYEHNEMTDANWTSVLFIEMFYIFSFTYQETSPLLQVPILRSRYENLNGQNVTLSNNFYVLFSDVLSDTRRISLKNGTKVNWHYMYNYLTELSVFCKIKYESLKQQKQFISRHVMEFYGALIEHYKQDLYNLISTLSYYDDKVIRVFEVLKLYMIFSESTNLTSNSINSSSFVIQSSDFFEKMHKKAPTSPEVYCTSHPADNEPWIFLRMKKRVEPRTTKNQSTK